MTTGLDVEIGEGRYEFELGTSLTPDEMAYEVFSNMARRVEEVREASMTHYKEFWKNMKQLPRIEQLVLYQKEMNRQLHEVEALFD